MLTRPLAYKGPVDHLSRYFSMSSLYCGMQVLLNEEMMDWQFLTDEKMVKGIFLNHEKLIKAQLNWPLSETQTAVRIQCDCYKINNEASDSKFSGNEPSEEVLCEHLAALAIESKVRLERLPAPIKTVDSFSSELDYLQNWLKRQTYDPFPNMARHRVIYLLDHKNGQFYISVHKAYLTQQNEYQRKAELPCLVDYKGKLPKFVSLTDQAIFAQMKALVSEQNNQVLNDNAIGLNFPQSITLLNNIVASGRCFWRSCHRLPLVWKNILIKPEVNMKLTDNLYLNKVQGLVLHQINIDQTINFLHSNLTDIKIKPCLTISSEQIYLPWVNASLKEKISYSIDVAKVSFYLGSEIFSLQSLINDLFQQTDVACQNLSENIASLVHQLDNLPSIYNHFELPISQKFDIGDRYLQGDLSHWLMLFRGLQSEGWQIIFDKQFRLNQKSVDHWYSRVNIDEGDSHNHWFELEVGVKVDGKTINILPYIVTALKQKHWNFNQEESEFYVTLNDGTRVQLVKERLQNILANLVELSEVKNISEKGNLKLPISQLSRIIDLEQSIDAKTLWNNSQWLKQKSARLIKLQQLKPAIIPKNINAKLREYQKEGVNWLETLCTENFSGILADDMGLGKTLQTLTHIQIEKNNGRMKTPCLVVAPTSLLGNWVVEAQRFTPELKLIEWSGVKRERYLDELQSSDMIITSYGVLLRDFFKLSQLDLYLLILDEAQTIKNARSKIAKVAYKMKSQHKLCLTGTPLENHLGELWSLFHFLMPGFLGDEAQFKRLFRWPIEREYDTQRQQILSQRIAPFMLRRTKNKVATDLPEKTTVTEYVELSEVQSDLYETVRLSMLKEVQSAINDHHLGKNKILIGNALLRLRQICCHPILVNIEQKSYTWESSAKLMWLKLKLPEMINNKQRILIFSSFTSVLDLIAELLQKLNINYITLTGNTKNRSELIHLFQSGTIPIFLISLKAGGTGLNLTQADTVIHFDPWWNPAAESQASARSHRIGQTKPVFIYKLISKGTVEERIHLMQQKKKQLASNLYQHDFSQKPFDQIDWQFLLLPLED